jgi:tight adherence protein C
MAIALSAAIFMVFATSIALIGYRLYARSGRIHERLGAAVIEAPTPEQIGQFDQPRRTWFVRVIQTVGEKVPISPQDASVARRGLIAAGFRSDVAVRVLYGCKILLAVVLLIAVLLVRSHIANPVLSVLVIPVSVLVGYFLPGFFLERMIDSRQMKIRLSLPDALDLMVVCMEAGLGLDQAIANVARELRMTHKVISDELGLVTLEMRAGKRRAEALKNLADRTGESDLRKLVATMIQSDRFGTSVADSLRTHADFMRVRRRQDAEERAAKVGVKMVFPIFFFILPSILVVAVGPGVLALFKRLIPLMKGQ